MDAAPSNRWSRISRGAHGATAASSSTSAAPTISSGQPTSAVLPEGGSGSRKRSVTPVRKAPAWRRLALAEDADADGPGQPQCTVKFLVPQPLVGVRSGSASLIAGLRQSCSANLSLSEFADCNGFRQLSATSALGEEPLRRVGRKFIERLSEHARQAAFENVSAEGALKMSVLVPGVVVGSLLGPGGNFMKRLEQATGVKVKIHEAFGNARGPDVTQEVSMLGTEEALEQVLAEVIKQLHAVHQEPWFAAWAKAISMPSLSENGEAEALQCTMRFSVSKALAGALIGRGGSFVAAMEQRCQAKLKIIDVNPGRVLNAVADSEEALEKVIQQMVDRLTEISVGDLSEEPLKLGALMPKAAVGGLIGPGGSVIKKLCASTGARINVHEPEAKTPGPEATQEVTVSGDANALEQALVEMSRIVQTFRKEPWFLSWANLSATVEKPSNVSTYALKYLIPEALAPAIIGTRGSVIDSMREHCRAKLTLRHGSEQFPHTESRVLIATAESQDSIDRVSEQVVDFLSKAATSAPSDALLTSKGDLKLSVLIPRHAVGAIIGAGGSSIKQLEASTDTKIKVHEAPGTATAPDVTHEVSICGAAKGLVQVLAELNLQVQGSSRESWFANWTLTPPLNCGNAVSSAGKKLVNDTMDGLPQALWEDARGFSMSCVVPGRLVAAMIGHGGVHLKEVQNITGTKIYLREMPDAESRSMNIVGPLANVASGYMLMMKRYLEAEAQVAPLN